MAGIIFDTSVYISAIRSGDTGILDLRRASRMGSENSGPLWLSAVVLSELLIGAVDRTARRRLLEMEKEFVRVNRLLVPQQSDWRLSGEVLSLIGQQSGYEQVRRARMTNDALIAMSVARNGFVVLTKNPQDFEQIAKFRAFKWERI
jgi:predicted nucleic acid-binding protein